MKIYATTALAVLCFLSLNLTAQQYRESSDTKITFEITNAGLSVEGTFKSANASGTFDPGNTENINLTGIAYAKSVFTDNSLRDKHLQNKQDFFYISKTPILKMKSTKVIKQAAGKYIVYWDLTMRGITKKIKTTMIAKKSGSAYLLSSSFKINRNTWELGGGGLKTVLLGDIVTVNISSTFN